LKLLGKEYVTDVLNEHLLPECVKLLHQLRSDKIQIILLSEATEEIVRPLAKELNVESWICNHLHYQDGKATGKLEEPVVGGYKLLKWIENFSEERGIRIQDSALYSSLGEDLLLMAKVGKPCAINPDF